MRRARSVGLAAGLLVAAGIGGRAEPVAGATPDAASARRVSSCAAAELELAGGEHAFAAIAKGRLRAYTRPEGRPLRVFQKLNVNGYPTVFGVLAAVGGTDCRPAWYRVQLPIRPNGSTGYVRASAVALRRVQMRIEVDLSERRIDIFSGGRLVLSTPTAIGSRDTPTPTGRYYVNQLLLAPDPGGPFGPGAIGISAFSPVLKHWAQGGPIAIHGTNVPSSIGHAISHGCLRIANDAASRLLAETPAGTPVTIRP